ncbi:MAG: ABC transporter permease [Elusimicrobia bacterium]|nr:ABC transporter permease [Elusimicrobiota bacterium]
MASLIRLKNINKTYQIGSSEVKALRDVSLEINPGEFIAVMGPSGSGKSTLMHIIGFLDRPDSGEYFFSDSAVHNLKENQLAAIRSKMTGFIFQSFHLLAKTNALNNVMLPMVYAGASDGGKDRALECMKLVGLSDRAKHKPNELSGGQQQRVAIARALINEPLIILADEPSGNLDAASREEVTALLKNLHSRGLTIIIVTHDPELGKTADRIILMKDGRVASDQSKTSRASAPDAAQIALPQSRIGFGLIEVMEQLRIALVSIWSHKIRSSLTMLGIFVGVGSIIAMLTLGKGTQKIILGDMEAMGAKTLMVIPGSLSQQGVRREYTRINFDDSQDIASRCSSVARVSPVVQNYGQLSRGGKNMNAAVFGLTADGLALKNISSLNGRFFTVNEDVSRARVVILHSKAAEELFDEGENPLNQEIRINKNIFTVIGVIPKNAQESLAVNMPRNSAIVPLNTAMKRLFGQKDLSQIEIEALSADKVDAAKEEAARLLRQRHGILEGQEDGFEIFSFASMLEMIKKGLGIFTAFLASIAAVSLLVGGIGIMNIMLVSVTERTREIGLRKALGARKADILAQFLIEAVIICLIGGGLGVAFGLGIAKTLAIFIHIQPVINLGVIITAFLFSTGVGVIFGFWPAFKAAKLNPIDALRYE